MQNMMRYLVMLFVCLLVGTALAAEARTGTIEEVRQDQGYVIISGEEYGYSEQETDVYYQQDRLGSQYLIQGMVVRYTVTADGTLQRLDILGPDEILRQLEQQ